MTTWNIDYLMDGVRCYTQVVSTLRSPKHAQAIIAAWHEQRQRLQMPAVSQVKAWPYPKNTLDRYGN